jgi:putative transposase
MWSRSTYFLSTVAAGRRNLFQKTQHAELFIDTVRGHHVRGRFDIHAFVVMPDHIHLLLTPGDRITLERAVTFVKGTFSYRMKKELGYLLDVWAEGYHDERIRSVEHCVDVIDYIEMNPVWRGLVGTAREFPFSSASGRWRMNALPQWLKPNGKKELSGDLSSSAT